MYGQLFHQLATASVGFIDPALCTQISLIVFFVVFIGAAIWTLTRRRADVDHWSTLPLGTGNDVEHLRRDREERL
jgi:hypothetical protein